jgi:TetR/AcrR family transcriptional regulator, transcriptional repressor for nem operon
MTPVRAARKRRTNTADRILDAAERMVQHSGYNGFSYADLATELGITKPSLHHHFATKATLGQALVERYTEVFMAALAGIDERTANAFARLEAYAKLYADVLAGNRICLCGMLAAEYETLPRAMKDGVRRFFDANETWLAGQIERGRRDGRFHARGTASEGARMLLGALEGATLVARPYNDVGRFNSAARQVLAGLLAKP